MSEAGLFIIGAIVFAVTVYGSVMAGGIALSRQAEADDRSPVPEQPATDP
jgi:hypothetical protein